MGLCAARCAQAQSYHRASWWVEGWRWRGQHTLLEKIQRRHDWSLPIVILEFKFIFICCKNMSEQDTLLPSRNFYLQFVDPFYFKKTHWALPEI